MLGGMMMAMELDAAMSAVENAGVKPLSIIAGMSIAPSAATVAGPEPDIAPNMHDTMTQTMAMPPR